MPGYSRVFIALWFCYSFPFGARQQPPSQVTSVLFMIYGVFFSDFQMSQNIRNIPFQCLGVFTAICHHAGWCVSKAESLVPFSPDARMWFQAPSRVSVKGPNHCRSWDQQWAPEQAGQIVSPPQGLIQRWTSCPPEKMHVPGNIPSVLVGYGGWGVAYLYIISLQTETEWQNYRITELQLYFT